MREVRYDPRRKKQLTSAEEILSHRQALEKLKMNHQLLHVMPTEHHLQASIERQQRLQLQKKRQAEWREQHSSSEQQKLLPHHSGDQSQQVRGDLTTQPSISKLPEKPASGCHCGKHFESKGLCCAVVKCVLNNTTTCVNAMMRLANFAICVFRKVV